MGIEFEHRKPQTNSGKLRTPITFYEFAPNDGPMPGQGKRKELFFCYAEVYNPSMKDLSIMSVKGTKEAVTIRIRDPGSDYIPTNKHFAELADYRYKGKTLSVQDVRPDLTENRFITILLGVTS